MPAPFIVQNDCVDRCLIASRLGKDAVVGFASALAARELVGAPYEAQYLTQSRVGIVCYADCVFQPVHPAHFPTRGDIESVTRHGLDLKVTCLARTFVDCFTRPRFAPEPADLISAFVHASGTLDIDRCIALTVATESRGAVSRLAFALSCSPIALASHQHDSLRRAALRQPDSFSRAHRSGKDCLDGRWDLIVRLGLLAMRIRP